MRDLNPANFRNSDDFLAAVEENIEILLSVKNELIGLKIKKSYQTLESRFKFLDAQPALRFIPTGLGWLDSYLARGGFAEGSFINIAGASGAGKTFLILQILQKLGESEKVAFFSFEMHDKVLYRKLKYSKQAFRANTYFLDESVFLDQIEADVKMLAKDYGVKIFAIDSRMKIQIKGQKDEYLKNMEISAVLSRLCRELGAIILLINQRSNESLKTGQLGLKGGNEQVYDSDMIFYVEYDKETNERWLICDKDRLSDSGKKWKVKIPDLFKKEPREVYFNEEPERADLR